MCVYVRSLIPVQILCENSRSRIHSTWSQNKTSFAYFERALKCSRSIHKMVFHNKTWEYEAINKFRSIRYWNQRALFTSQRGKCDTGKCTMRTFAKSLKNHIGNDISNNARRGRCFRSHPCRTMNNSKNDFFVIIEQFQFQEMKSFPCVFKRDITLSLISAKFWLNQSCGPVSVPKFRFMNSGW